MACRLSSAQGEAPDSSLRSYQKSYPTMILSPHALFDRLRQTDIIFLWEIVRDMEKFLYLCTQHYQEIGYGNITIEPRTTERAEPDGIH